MMGRLVYITSLLWMFLSALPLYSANDENETGWTLEKCIVYALQNNISIQSAKIAIDAEEANLLEAKSSRLPSLSASTSVSGNNSRAFDNTGGEFTKGAQIGLNTDVPIYRGGIINNNIKAGEIELEKARLDVAEAQNDIVLSITQAWLNILYARENYLYYQDVVETSQVNLERYKALFEAGTISRKDLAEIESQYASDRYSMVLAKNELDTRITDLKTMLDLSYDVEFNPLFPAQVDVPKDEVPTLDAIVADVLTNRPEIKNSQLSEDVAHLDLANAKAGYLPTINLNASASSSYSDIYNGSLATQMNDRFTQYVGLSVSVPIFSRNQNKANVTRSKVMIYQAELNARETKNNLLQTVEQVFVEVKAQQQRFLAAQEKVNAAKISYEYQQEQFQLGLSNAIDLRQSKNDLLNANAELIQARYSVLLYRKILDFYRGLPVVAENREASMEANDREKD
ncbi:TolC family protein [Thermophagus sp. OGC60D27]|uniref:TolC family protein n=1 Tax=Thermophagus sp. OGC60D27 TaxID=3458415 RepID=UPI004037D62B